MISVIITTYNSAGTLKNLLISLKKQSYQNIEIIVVDNNSKDATVSISRSFTNKIFKKGPERSAQRNYGAKLALGEYLLFLDSDMVLQVDVIKQCVEEFKKNDTLVGEVIIPEKSFGRGIWAKAKILEREMNLGENYFEAARFMPKKIWNEMGGFDETLTGPEDWDLPQRVAKRYNVKRIKSFILHNEGNLSLQTLFKKKYYYGLSVNKYLKKQNLPVISPVTIYFLRPGFYKNWKMLFKNPLTTFCMITMLSIETIGGGLGYINGKFKN